MPTGTISQRRTYTALELARVLGISQDYFLEVVRKGVIKHFVNDEGDPVNGKYGIEAISQFVTWLRNKRNNQTPASRYEEARTVKVEKSLIDQDLKIMMMRGKIAPIPDIEMEWANATIPLRNKILGLPTYVGRMLEERSYEEIVKILTDVVNEIWESIDPPTPEKILRHNKKLASYSEVLKDNENGDSDEKDEK